MNNEQNEIIEKESPKIELEFTPRALEKLESILMHTLSMDVLRIMVTGKGCDGFTYQFGFTDSRADDIAIATPLPEVFIYMDPFTAFYGHNLHLDYVVVDEDGNHEEGFFITDKNGETYKGKFWKEKTELIPNIVPPSSPSMTQTDK